MLGRPHSRRSYAHPAAVLVALCLTHAASGGQRARAQEVGYAGTWQASPLSVRYTLQSWGPDCGPSPTASSQPGGRVTITTEGSHLRFAGAFSGVTSACWSDNAEVRRVSSAARPESWSAACATVVGNPRGESGRYTFTVRDPDTLAYSERTTYQWQLNDSTCTATRTASRTLTRTVPAAVPPEAPTPSEPEAVEPEPEAAATCVAGAPTTLRMRGPTAALEPGARFCFAPRATDASGCPLDQPPVVFRVTGPSGSTGRMEGRCFITSDSAAEAEADYRVIATLGSLEAHADLQVRSTDLSGLIAVRERESSSGSAALTPAPSEGAAGVATAVSQPGGARNGLLLAVSLLLLGGTIGCVLLAMRLRRGSAGAPSAAHQAKLTPVAARVSAARAETLMAEPEPGAEVRERARPIATFATHGLLTCPTCGVAGAGGERFCSKHGVPLLPAAENPLRAAGMICPSCRRGYPPDAEFCPHDRAALVPYSLYGRAESPRDPSALPRICPVCGERYGPHVTFCGKDGASLSPVN